MGTPVKYSWLVDTRVVHMSTCKHSTNTALLCPWVSQLSKTRRYATLLFRPTERQQCKAPDTPHVRDNCARSLPKSVLDFLSCLSVDRNFLNPSSVMYGLVARKGSTVGSLRYLFNNLVISESLADTPADCRTGKLACGSGRGALGVTVHLEP